MWWMKQGFLKKDCFTSDFPSVESMWIGNCSVSKDVSHQGVKQVGFLPPFQFRFIWNWNCSCSVSIQATNGLLTTLVTWNSQQSVAGRDPAGQTFRHRKYYLPLLINWSKFWEGLVLIEVPKGSKTTLQFWLKREMTFLSDFWLGSFLWLHCQQARSSLRCLSHLL